MKYRIIERRKQLFLIDHDDGEFGKVHPVRRTFDLETITWPPETVKSFKSFRAAETWAKKNRYEVGEVC